MDSNTSPDIYRDELFLRGDDTTFLDACITGDIVQVRFHLNKAEIHNGFILSCSYGNIDIAKWLYDTCLEENTKSSLLYNLFCNKNRFLDYIYIYSSIP